MGAEVLNISPVIVWVVALSQLLTFGLTVWNLMASGSRANTREIEKNRARLDGHEARLSSVEQTLSGMPGREDVHKMQVAIAEMGGYLREMRAEMRGSSEIIKRIEIAVDRHENHLLDGAKR
ncbi:DUF2730 domain-containing protein [Defluviimonas sp. WL0024]|uniref:DUF2730 domain-containing protein n=1 Tax=Albidovulum salinarum TaxID=2984153 RepID=A0ABT2X8T9_9RHOB|nr:DUF2730 domain-containing protein [Defluviimonas sp. WL0024]MCU9850364.1 DUF2730 domain-containing protein [Defluviimonas sp. WL0024]